MKIAFTTLGCPGWDLDTICRRGREYGYDGVDFRGYLETLDITTLPMFTSGVAEVRRRLTDAGLETSAISSSIRVCEETQLGANLEEAKRTIRLARALGTRNVRVFGGGDLKTRSRYDLVRVGLETVSRLLELDGASDLRWLFETHDAWIKGSECKMLLDNVPNPAFGVLWDMGHTPRVGGETPAQTWAAVGPRVGYTHLKDARHDPAHPQAMEDGWRYVLPGEGQLPLAEAVALLRAARWDGWLLFEHEKRWHPDLTEPEVAFPAYSRWIRPLVSGGR